MKKYLLSCMIFAAVLIIANTATSAVDCTCAFSIEKLNYSQGISLPYSKDFCEIEVTPNVLSKGTCSIPGHPVSTFTSSIEILSDDNHIISNIVGNKVYCENLPFGSSSIRLRYTISNGYKEAYQDTLDIGILRRYPPPTISAPGYAFNGWINRFYLARRRNLYYFCNRIRWAVCTYHDCKR